MRLISTTPRGCGLRSRIDGFISVERFESLTNPDKMLSLSTWQDEAAVANWRKHVGHRGVQGLGRDGVLRDYRLRVGGIIRDYGLDERREETPADSRGAFGT